MKINRQSAKPRSVHTSGILNKRNQQPEEVPRSNLPDKRQRLERALVEISEREQCRLGQDLHDGLGQELAGIALLSKCLAKKLETESHPSAKAAADIAATANNAIDSARRLAKGLYPLELSRKGLIPALEELANQTSLRFGVFCGFRQTGEAPIFEMPAAIHIYRIVQEAIGNAIKHGEARRIAIESLAGTSVHTFSVTDDGRGFAKPATTGGMGLHLMDYRARAIGALINVSRPAEGGCRVTCQIPV